MIRQTGPITIRWYGLTSPGVFVTGYFIEKRIFLDAGRKIMELE
jgi:prolipoprotein diacylglyceryltransferase